MTQAAPITENSTQDIRVSPVAAEHMRASLAKRGKGLGVRLRTKKTGCSGYEYVVEYADELETMDHEFSCEGVRVFVDPKSMILLKGILLDFVEKGLKKGFVFENPNEKSRCGCGESFSI